VQRPAGGDGKELPGPPAGRVMMQAGQIYLAVTGGLYLRERGRL